MAVFYTGRGSGGVKLPALSNPASASEIGEGYDAINAAGERVIGTGELAVNLNPELTAQDALIANIMTTLEGKTAGGGAEVVTGSFTLSSGSSGSITIPGLIGKENFSLAFHGDLMSLSVMTMIRCQLLAETNAFVYEFVDPDATFYVGDGIAGLGATMWDSSTGTLTRTTPPSYFLAGDWYYIGW